MRFRSHTAYIESEEAEDKAKEILKCGKTISLAALSRLVQGYEKAKKNALALDRKHEGDGSPRRSNPSSEFWRLIDLIRGIATAT